MEEFREESLKILSEFEPIWGSHLGQINMVKHRIELTPNDACAIHCPPCQADPKAGEFGQM